MVDKKREILFIIGKVHFASSQGTRYHALISNLQTTFEIRVLTLYPEIFNNLNYEKGNITLLNKYFRSVFKWLYSHFIEGFLFPDKYIFIIKKYKSLIDRAFLLKNYDYVILGLTPFSLYTLAPYIKIKHPGLSLICDLSDPFTDNAANKYWLPFWKYRVRKFEDNSLSFINKIIVLNPSIKALYVKTYKSLIAENIYVVEQGFNLREPTISPPFFKNKIKLLYAGGLYSKFREPFELFKAIQGINNQKLELYLYGNIAAKFIPGNCSNIMYGGVLSQEDLFNKYNESQLLIFIDNNRGIQVPGKLFEVISQNKPVLFIYSNMSSPSMNYLKNSTNVFPVYNVASNIQSMIELILKKDLNSFAGTDVNNFTWERLSQKYLSIIEK
jgi:hypothetical protein